MHAMFKFRLFGRKSRHLLLTFIMAMELLEFADMFVCEAKVGQITLVFCD
jgi:hypothetical protein